MLEIKNLTATVDGKKILQGISLVVERGTIHAIMGPNGSGKSTLAKIIAGHPGYEVESGEVLFEGQNILDLDPEERAHLGLFMSFQYPVEIPGVSNHDFLRQAYNACLKAKNQRVLTDEEFSQLLDEKIACMEMKPEFKERNINEGFSGGEKKRNEMLQMAVLDPQFAILDETDSGLDIDALRTVARGVNKLMNPSKALVVITHYQRLLEYIKPHFVHVLIDGKIVLSGGSELALELESRGYDWLEKSPQEQQGR